MAKRILCSEPLNVENSERVERKYGVSAAGAIWHDIGDYQLVEFADGSVTAHYIDRVLAQAIPTPVDADIHWRRW